MTSRSAALLAALFAGALLSACSSGEGSDPAPKTSVKAAPTDEEQLIDLATDFWDARVAAQNSGNTDRTQFQGLASPLMIEGEVATLQQYQKLGLTRVGEPEITAVEAAVEGDKGRIVLCLNEDEWGAESTKDEVRPSEPRGAAPWVAEAIRDGDRWVVDAEGVDYEALTKDKTC